MTYDNAEHECNTRYGGNLATIQSEGEDQFVHFLKESSHKHPAFLNKDEIRINLCFQSIENTLKISTETIILNNIPSSSLCKQECVRLRFDLGFECNSVVWISNENECLLNIGNITKNVIVSEELQYYEDSCFDKPSEEPSDIPLAMPVSQVRNCFAKTRFATLQGVVGKVYDRISLNDCLGECWNCEDCFEENKCQTAIYYEEDAMCIITNVSAKITRERVVKEDMSSLYEKRVKCLENNCEDLEVHLVFGIDPAVYNETITKQIMIEIFSSVSRITEFVRVTAVLLSSSPSNLFDDLQYENENDFKFKLETLKVSADSSDFEAGLIEFLNGVDEHWTTTDDVDVTWVLVLTDTAFQSRLGLFLDLKEGFRRFPLFSIGVGENLDFEKLEMIASSVDNIVHIQDPVTIGKALAPRICHQKPLRRFVTSRKLKKTKTDHSFTWLGLHRNDYGKMEWSDKSVFGEYENEILKYLSVTQEDGDCILRKGTTNWAFANCTEKHNFMCTLEPRNKLEDIIKRRLNIKKLY
uniref:C-type lectin domain-containing protein n=2 Tax=Bursaphelenchus xylophilus TaxID=6326 RepID=A0A1I7RN79_BURXY